MPRRGDTPRLLQILGATKCEKLSDNHFVAFCYVRVEVIHRIKFLLSHIHDYVTYAAHGRQYLIEVYVVR